MTNQYGLDVSYFKAKLGQIVRDCANYTPEEMARSLDTYKRVAIDEGIVHGEQLHRKALELSDELKTQPAIIRRLGKHETTLTMRLKLVSLLLSGLQQCLL